MAVTLKSVGNQVNHIVESALWELNRWHVTVPTDITTRKCTQRLIERVRPAAWELA
jgi:hypothetical protein